jgi:hypothetical protein
MSLPHQVIGPLQDQVDATLPAWKEYCQKLMHESREELDTRHQSDREIAKQVLTIEKAIMDYRKRFGNGIALTCDLDLSAHLPAEYQHLNPMPMMSPNLDTIKRAATSSSSGNGKKPRHA